MSDHNKNEITKEDKFAADLTNAQTDTEAGNEKLSPDEEREKDIFALKALHESGVISDDEFNQRMKELNDQD